MTVATVQDIASTQEEKNQLGETPMALKDPQDLLPLTPVVFHTLLALADGECHGYAIAQEVERRTEGRVRMGPGTLYGSLRRMCTQGLIEEIAKRKDPAAHGERRRYYTLTDHGRRVVQAETRRLSDVVSYACRKLSLGLPEFQPS